MKKIIWQFYAIAIIFVVWWVFCATGIFDKLLTPSPLTIVNAMVNFISSGEIWRDFFATAIRVFAGAIGGIAAGLISGALICYNKKIGDSLLCAIDFLRSIPGPALIPVFMLFFGVGDKAKILLVCFIVGLMILVSIIQGVSNANQTRILFARSLRLSKWRTFFSIYLPDALPSLSTGIRLAISFALIAAVVSEMTMSTPFGLGKKIIDYQLLYEINKMYAIIIIIGLFGYVMNKAYLIFEKRHFHWLGK